MTTPKEMGSRCSPGSAWSVWIKANGGIHEGQVAQERPDVYRKPPRAFDSKLRGSLSDFCEAQLSEPQCTQCSRSRKRRFPIETFHATDVVQRLWDSGLDLDSDTETKALQTSRDGDLAFIFKSQLVNYIIPRNMRSTTSPQVQCAACDCQ